jgi:predicted DNA-binding helix-hairpin-helix protein
MKRVYYSGYVPVSNDVRLPAIGTQVPLFVKTGCIKPIGLRLRL